MPLLRRLLLSALVVTTASALCVCAALASASPLVAKRTHPRLTIIHRALAPVSRLAPGDSAQRTLELRYRGRGRFGRVVLRVNGANHSLLGSTLQLKIQRCSTAWQKLGARGYQCRGRLWDVLGTVPLSSNHPFRLRHLSARAGRTDHLRIALALPLRSGNALQHRLARIVYAFTGIAG
jgi:hypothetical protein